MLPQIQLTSRNRIHAGYCVLFVSEGANVQRIQRHGASAQLSVSAHASHFLMMSFLVLTFLEAEHEACAHTITVHLLSLHAFIIHMDLCVLS